MFGRYFIKALCSGNDELLKTRYRIHFFFSSLLFFFSRSLNTKHVTYISKCYAVRISTPNDSVKLVVLYQARYFRIIVRIMQPKRLLCNNQLTLTNRFFFECIQFEVVNKQARRKCSRFRIINVFTKWKKYWIWMKDWKYCWECCHAEPQKMCLHDGKFCGCVCVCVWFQLNATKSSEFLKIRSYMFM